MDELMKALDDLSMEDLETVKAKVSELIKAKKDSAKDAEKVAKATTEAERVARAQAEVTVGSVITFTMKGETRTAEVLKKTDKTATVQLPEGKRFIQFRFITDIEAPATEVAA